MNCITNFILLALTCIVSVFARKEIARPTINGFIYALYDDGRATLTGCKYGYNEWTIPAYVTYQGERYQLTIIQGSVFKNEDFNVISVAADNKALLIKRNAFNGIRSIREFRFNSKKVEPEIGSFNGASLGILIRGQGIPYAMEKLTKQYFKKWKITFGKDYTNVSESERMKDLFTLAKNFQRNFSIYEKVLHGDNAANVALLGSGNTEGYARLYRVMAIFMGFPEDHILVGCDTIHLCWNYVKVDNYDGVRKWHVVDATQYISDAMNMNYLYFQDEKEYVKSTLNPYYHGDYTVSPHNFVIKINKYNYLGEPSVKPFDVNFDTWLKNNNGGLRTL